MYSFWSGVRRFAKPTFFLILTISLGIMTAVAIRLEDWILVAFDFFGMVINAGVFIFSFYTIIMDDATDQKEATND